MIILQKLNTFDQEQFTTILRSLFEGPPWIVTQTWHAQPFASLDHLHQSLCTVMYNASVEQQIALLQAHPDLVGRAALAGTLTPESSHEQASAGLDQLSAVEVATFSRLNQTYRDRFGFPFVICARENKKDSILTGFAARLQNSRQQEITLALGEVAKICSLRLRDLIQMDSSMED